jgi:hypothetical protein
MKILIWLVANYLYTLSNCLEIIESRNFYGGADGSQMVFR